jgi:hypothetical protein
VDDLKLAAYRLTAHLEHASQSKYDRLHSDNHALYSYWDGRWGAQKLLTVLVGIVVSSATKEERAGKLSPAQAVRIRAKAKRLHGK